jgi:hypothetical protein
MPTTTRPRRFTGPAMNPRRHAAPQRRGVAGGWMQRRQPKQSTMQRMMGGMGKAKPGRKGAGGLAALAGAAGLAFKNRNRLASMLRRKNDAPQG